MNFKISNVLLNLVSSELSSVNILNLAFKESTGVDLHSKSSSSIDIVDDKPKDNDDN